MALDAYAPSHAADARRRGDADTERFRLRRFLDTLAREGELVFHDDNIDLIDVARVLESTPQAVAFRQVGGRNDQLVGNVMATRKRLALSPTGETF